MEIENKKRGRGEAELRPVEERKGKRRELPDVLGGDGPPGVFEFPWQKGKGGMLPESDDGWDLRDVFFSSLVDGCSAAIDFPGARLSQGPAPAVALLEDGPWAPDEETDGVDCVWSCVMSQPATLRRTV